MRFPHPTPKIFIRDESLRDNPGNKDCSNRFSESYWQLVPHPLGPPPPVFLGDEILGDNLGNNEFSAIGNECHTHVIPQSDIDRTHEKIKAGVRPWNKKVDIKRCQDLCSTMPITYTLPSAPPSLVTN